MSIEQQLLEQELGRISFRILAERLPTNFLASLAEQKAFHVLQSIHNILENDSLSDFDCVEEIVCTLERAGMSVSRHDFG